MVARTILYIIWYAGAVLYFIMGLWATLEKAGKSHKNHNPKDYYKPAFFILCVAILSTLVDQYLVDSMAKAISLDPLLIRLALFPAMLFFCAQYIGGSKEVVLKSKYKRK